MATRPYTPFIPKNPKTPVGNSRGVCPTVAIKWNTVGDHLIINECDFDPAEHEIWTPPTVTIPPPLPPLPPLPKPPVHPALADLPDDWRSQSAKWLRGVAEKVTGRTPETKEQAIEMIAAALPPSFGV